jgi:N-acetylglucosaminyldiphosphoundecaprenol N-acetyl-beta-D-mannosaminyltransferase
MRDSDIEWVEAMGIRFSNLTFDEAVGRIVAMARTPEPQFAVTPNVDHIVQMRRDADMRAIYREADLSLCDGMPLKWAMTWLGRPLKEKVSGSDLAAAVCGAAAREGVSVFFLGAAAGVAEECARRLTERFPGLKVAGVHSPPMGLEKDPESERRVIEIIRQARPGLLLVALGTPRQEKFIHRNLRAMNVPMSVGVGAAFDFIAGVVPRAPRWMRRCGLEWLWRLAREPKRLWRRYLVDDMRFFGIVWREWRRERGRR